MGAMKTIYGGKTALSASNEYENQFNRVFVRDGLSYESEPLVTGFFFLSFEYPTAIESPENKEYGSNTKAQANAVLNSVNTGIDLPDISISQVVVEGLGGTWNAVPGRLDIGKTFNVKYWETFNGEVINVHRQWLFQIRDPRSGAARIGGSKSPADVATKYRQDKYKGQLWWWMTDPNIDRIVFAIEFLGIWPTNLPLSNITNDIATNDKIEINITYSYDRPFFYPGTVVHCSDKYLSSRFKMLTEIEKDKGDVEG